MTALVLLVGLSLATLLLALFLLGFRLGGDHWQREALRIREEGVRASRAMHDLTVQAFAAMTDEIERRRHSG